jgi:hypothetical protein
MLCGDRAVPRWGKPEDGKASATTLKTTLWAEMAPMLARHGVAPGASISIADAALVTEDNRKALGNPLCLSRFPATSKACERAIAAAVTHAQWDEVGLVAQTKPPRHRPAAASKGAQRPGPLYGHEYRAVVLHSSSQAQRRQQR